MEGRSLEVPEVTHECTLTVRVDYETLHELERIALYEHEKRATLARRFIVEKVQTYLRNPAYKRFLKMLEEKRQRELERQKRKAEEKRWTK